MSEESEVAVDSSVIDSNKDPPIVFLCPKCNAILGDSYAWIGINQELGSVTLNATSNKVGKSKTLITSTEGEDVGSTYVPLKCTGCKSVLGKVYQTTPQRLDDLRDMFSFDLDKISSYEIGSSQMQNADSGQDSLLNLPNIHYLTQQLRKMQGIIMTINNRLTAIEGHLNLDEMDNTLAGTQQNHEPAKENSYSRKNKAEDDIDNSKKSKRKKARVE